MSYPVFLYDAKFAKFSWSNSQSLFSNFSECLGLGNLRTELGNYSVRKRRLDRVINVSESERRPEFVLVLGNFTLAQI